MLFFACKKEAITTDNNFPMNYYFYNNGDTSLKIVSLNCTTCYPVQNETGWLCVSKWRNAYPWNSKSLLHDHDSILAVPDINVYSGCFYNYTVSLGFVNSRGSGYYKNYSRTDTIHKINDALIKFHWPKDTLYFTRVYN